MKNIEVLGEIRENLGKKFSHELRKAGKVPCVFYGKDEVVHFTSLVSDLKDLIYTPHVYLVTLNIDGKKYDAVLQDAQYHPVSDKILHLDFLKAYDDKPISIAIPVTTTGLAKGIQQGGKMAIILRRLLVRGLKNDLPDTLNIDVTKIGLGQTVKVGHLSYPNLELLDNKNAVVVAVRLTRAAKGDELLDGEEEEETTTEGAEGASEETSEEKSE